MVGKGAVGLHLFAQRFRQIDIKPTIWLLASSDSNGG
jgi:hypothetical protein